MSNEEYVLTHRKQKFGKTVENLISLIPNENMFDLIKRIRPSADDEIVIRVMDYTLEANKEAKQKIDDLHGDALLIQRQKAIIDDLSF